MSLQQTGLFVAGATAGLMGVVLGQAAACMGLSWLAGEGPGENTEKLLSVEPWIGAGILCFAIDAGIGVPLLVGWDAYKQAQDAHPHLFKPHRELHDATNGKL